MATSHKRATTPRTRSPLAGCTLAQLLKLRAMLASHPDLSYARSGAGLILLYLPAWARDGWNRHGERIDGWADETPIAHLLPADGKLTGYCERKPASPAEARYCGTKAIRQPAATRRLSFHTPDAAILSAIIADARAKDRKRQARAAA